MRIVGTFVATLTGVVLTLAVAAASDGLRPIPALTARVTDATGTLNAQQKQTLESELATLEQRKGYKSRC